MNENGECGLFLEDEVCRSRDDVPDSFVFGLVLENSEYVSSDEDMDDEKPGLKKGDVRIAWHPAGAETIEQENKVCLFVCLLI